MSQNYSNHRQLVPIYHYFLAALTLAILIGAAINMFRSTGGDGLYSASLILAMAVAMTLIFFLMRVFALKVQDRVIRAEENLRRGRLRLSGFCGDRKSFRSISIYSKSGRSQEPSQEPDSQLAR